MHKICGMCVYVVSGLMAAAVIARISGALLRATKKRALNRDCCYNLWARLKVFVYMYIYVCEYIIHI